MKLQSVDQVAVFYEPEDGRKLRVGRLALKARQILFEYEPAFLQTKLELSPFRLPLKAGVVLGSAKLQGLMGVFDDSLPDGWGRLLLGRRAAELGISRGALTPLDRLTLVGARSMGALVYEPEIAIEDPVLLKLAKLERETQQVFAGTSQGTDLDRLIAVGGSPQGARPKVLIHLSPTGEIFAGARTLAPGFTAWLVKFRAPSDDRSVAVLEHSYFLMARAAGITVPRTQILGRTKQRAGYFAIERFDRSATTRRHTHTFGGLLELEHGEFSLDYQDLLKVTRSLTRDEAAVAEMFRRACFNVFAHNRDDHTRNFAFVMDERGGWQPSPAYDLTFSSGPGGEHAMLIAHEGRAPTRAHLLEVAKHVGLKRPAQIIDEVRAAVDRFGAFADEAGVPGRLRSTVASALGVPSIVHRRRR